MAINIDFLAMRTEGGFTLSIHLLSFPRRHINQLLLIGLLLRLNHIMLRSRWETRECKAIPPPASYLCDLCHKDKTELDRVIKGDYLKTYS